jgi:hypothetical protein
MKEMLPRGVYEQNPGAYVERGTTLLYPDGFREESST